MSNALDNQLFSLKFTAKQLKKQALKAERDERKEKEKIKKELQKGNTETAKIFASSAIRMKNEAINLHKLGSRIDAVASRVQTAVTMRRVTGDMGRVVKSMEGPMKVMDLEKMATIMEKFEQQVADMDVQTTLMEDTVASSTATSMPQDEVDGLLHQMADEANVELRQGIASSELDGRVADLSSSGSKLHEEPEDLAERLRALRPAT